MSDKPIVIQQGTTVNPVGAPVLHGFLSVASAGPFGRFEDLAGKLVQVPKSEIDEKRKGSRSETSQ